MPGYGHRYWAERTAASRRPTYPGFRGRATSDVVVIGGGLTGCAIAYALARAGAGVVLLESDRLAQGGTSAGLGAVLPEPDAVFRVAERDAGRRAARAAWQAAGRSASDFGRTLGKLTPRVDLEASGFAIDAPAGDLGPLRREQAARRAAGLVAPWLTTSAARTALGAESGGGLHFTGAYLVDPVRATLGLARGAIAAGAKMFERSAVRRTTFTRKDAEVVLTNGTIRTPMVVVATGEPGALYGQLRRHVIRRVGYAVVTQPLSAAMRREAGQRAAVVTDLAESPHWLRWLPDDRALFAGAVGRPVADRAREKTIVQRTAQLMYELSLRHPIISGLPAAWSWDVPVVTTPDSLPWIGPHRNYPHHFFALALGWHGDALSWAAARAAVRHFEHESTADDAALGFARYL